MAPLYTQIPDEKDGQHADDEVLQCADSGASYDDCSFIVTTQRVLEPPGVVVNVEEPNHWGASEDDKKYENDAIYNAEANRSVDPVNKGIRETSSDPAVKTENRSLDQDSRDHVVQLDGHGDLANQRRTILRCSTLTSRLETRVSRV